MISSKEEAKKRLISSRSHAETEGVRYCPVGYISFEVVGDNLVNTVLMNGLVEHAKGKALTVGGVLSIPEFCGENFLANLDEDERAIVGECLVKLIDTGRIRLLMPTASQG